MKIIPLTPEFYPQAAQIHAKTFKNWECWAQGDFQLFGARMTMIMACDDEAKVMKGFLVLRPLSEDMVDIVTFAVDPVYQNQGVGQALMDAAIDHIRAKGLKELFLEVATDNLSGLHIYEKLGFKTIGRRKNYYDHGQGKIDGLVMQLILV